MIDVATLVTEEWKEFNSRDEPFVAGVARSTYALLQIWVGDVIEAQDGGAADFARLGRRLYDVILPAKQGKLHSYCRNIIPLERLRNYTASCTSNYCSSSYFPASHGVRAASRAIQLSSQ